MAYMAYIPPTENRVEFLEKLQRVCGQISPDVVVQPILSTSGPLKLTVGNWSLISHKDGEVSIHNADGTKVSTVSNGPKGGPEA
jgi:E3 ubiquitin-protein ligase HECTD1